MSASLYTAHRLLCATAMTEYCSNHTSVGRWLLAALPACALGLTALALPRDAVHAQSADPCAGAAASADISASAQHERHDPNTPAKDTPRGAPKHRDALWAHRARPARVQAARAAGRIYEDGAVAVIEDAGDLMIRPNVFDLRDAGIRVTPNAAGGYDIARVPYGFRQPLGSRLVLDDDDSREDVLGFAFPFFGRIHNGVFVNSDGNVTFTAADAASTERSVTRVLTGPPRIAALFADLNPAAGGRVLISSGASAYIVTWCAVPEYGTNRRATTQVVLLPDGAIEMQWSGLTTVADAIAAISPGAEAPFAPVDLSAGAAGAAGAAIGEHFTTRSDLDTVAALRRFLASYPDEFHNVVMFTDHAVLTDAFAYELTIANDITGLNLETFDASHEWGSRGVLQSLVMMDALDKYPDNPHEPFLGTNSTVSVLGQEFGHRWLALLTFRDSSGRNARDLLGRDGAHWSFFFDSDASVLEGNDIEDLGGGQFRTVAATARYSKLDQYAMGLLDKSDVPPFYYVQNPTEVTPARTSRSAPEVGVTFRGTRRDITIADVIAASGERRPSAADSRRDYRQAFIYITSAGRDVGRAETAKVDRIRVAWEQFLSAATDSRMRVDTRLRSVAVSRAQSGDVPGER